MNKNLYDKSIREFKDLPEREMIRYNDDFREWTNLKIKKNYQIERKSTEKFIPEKYAFANPEMKVKGIYRMSMVGKDQITYSYIGISVDILKRWKTHIFEIDRLVKHKKLGYLMWYLLNFEIAPTHTSYYKMAIFIINNDLTIHDIQFEVLLEDENHSLEEMEKLETDFITQFNSEWIGFNGSNAKAIKHNNNIPIWEKKLIVADEAEIEEINNNILISHKLLELERVRQIKMIYENWKNGTKPIPTILYDFQNIDIADKISKLNDEDLSSNKVLLDEVMNKSKEIEWYFKKNYVVFQKYCVDVLAKVTNTVPQYKIKKVKY